MLKPPTKLLAILPRTKAQITKLLAIIVVIFVALLLAHCNGRRVERNAWEAKAERLEREAAERARKADEERRKALGEQGGNITTEREVLDNATKNLPDESPSARRRARICAELRATARRNKAPEPAC